MKVKITKQTSVEFDREFIDKAILQKLQRDENIYLDDKAEISFYVHFGTVITSGEIKISEK